MGAYDDLIPVAAAANPYADLVPVSRGTAQPRPASGALEAIESGWQGSATGLGWRRKLPDLVLDPANSKWWERALSGITSVAAELPFMVPGGMAGGAAGTAVGGAAGSVVPVVGNVAGAAVGGILGAGAGTFATPAAVRETLIQAYKSGEVSTPEDFWLSLQHVVAETGKAAAIGAATFGAGAAAARTVGAVIAPSIGTSLSVGGATKAIGAADLTAQIAAMTTMPAAFQGRLPSSQEILDAAIIVGGMKAAHVAAPKIAEIFVRTGRTPAEVVADAAGDPTIRAELIEAKPEASGEIPKAYEPLALAETVSRIVPDATTNEAHALNIAAVLAKPFGEVPAEKTPNYLNFRYVDGPQDLKAASARISEIFGEQIEQARGKESWEQTRVKAEALLTERARNDGRTIVIPEDFAAFKDLAARGMAIEAMSQKTAFDLAEIARRIEREGATVENTREMIEAIETSALALAVDQGSGAAIARAHAARKASRQTIALAKQFQDLAVKYGMEPTAEKPAPIFDAKAPFAKNTIFTAEKVAAARALLKSKIGQLNAGLDPEVLQAGLTIAGGYIEAGIRTFTEFSKVMIADIGEGIKPHLQELYDGATKEAKAIETERTYGKNAVELAKAINRLQTPEAINKFAAEASKATTWEKIVEVWKASILSGPVTQMANLIGNTTFAAMRPVVDSVAAAIGKVTKAEDRVSAAEPLARMFGDLQGAKDALFVAGEALKVAYQEGGIKGAIKEAAVGKEPDAALKAETFRKAIGGVTGDVIRLPFRALSLADSFFKTLNERGESYAMATRQAVKEGFNPATREFRERVVEMVQNPTKEMQDAIDAAGLRFTFNAPLGEFGQKVSSLVRADPFGLGVMPQQILIPFIRTPGNILKELIRMTPFAPLVSEWRAAIARGGAERHQALAELAMGTSIAAVVMSLAADGSISGAGDPEAGKRRVNRTAGWQQYSVEHDGTWYNYQRIQPLGTLIGMAADLFEVWDHLTDTEIKHVPNMLAIAFSNAVTNQSFLQGAVSIMRVGTEPSRWAPRFFQNLAGSVVPALIAQPTAMADPVAREVNSMLDAIKARVPGLREGLLPQIDVFGEPVTTKTRLGGISPVTETKVSDDKVRTEAARLGIRIADAPKKTHIGRGTGKLGDVEMTPEERNKFAIIGGKMAHNTLIGVVNTPAWDAMPDAAKRRVFSKVMEASHKYAAAMALPLDKRIGYIQSITEKMAVELQPETE